MVYHRTTRLLIGLTALVCGVGCAVPRVYWFDPSPVQVKVEDARTGRPILGARVGVSYEYHKSDIDVVIANRIDSVWVTTDKQGNAVVEAVTTGEWSVGCEGYEPQSPVLSGSEAAERKITVRLKRLNSD